MSKSNNTNDENLGFEKRKIETPKRVFYSVAGVFFTLGVLVVLLLIYFLITEFAKGCLKNVYTISIGVAGSLFSAGILLNAISTHLTNDRKLDEETHKSELEAVTNAIKEFNYKTIPLFNFVKTVQLETRGAIKNAKLRIKPTLDIQEDKIKEFESSFNNPDEYTNTLILKTIMYVKIESNVFSNDFYQYLANVQMNTKGYGLNKNTVGCSQILKFYHDRRIKVLNFFENLAIQYMNSLVDKDLMDAQFKNTILEVVNLFYYDIYKNEGNKSYPSLMVLCNRYNK